MNKQELIALYERVGNFTDTHTQKVSGNWR